MAKVYFTKRTDGCPYCGNGDSDQIRSDHSHLDTWDGAADREDMIVERECSTCGKEWEDVYRWVGCAIREFVKSEDDIEDVPF